MKRREGFVWWLRFAIGGRLQHLAWRLCDVHSNWVIDYTDIESGRPCSLLHEGPYSAARKVARKFNRGRIVGYGARVVAGNFDAGG